MFGKPKNAEEILKLIEGLSSDEKEKVLSALNSDTSTTETAQEEPNKEGAESENEDTSTTTEDTSTVQEEQMPDTEEVEETESEEVQETVNEEPQAGQPQAEEQQTETEEQPDAAPIPDSQGSKDVYEALIARFDALEAKVAQMEQANADRVAADNNQDFGFSPSAPNPANEDGERYSAVMKSYAGRNANKYY